MRWRPEVIEFADMMEYKLCRNDWKGHWVNEGDLSWFIRKMYGECKELIESLTESESDVEHVLEEAADVANFAMMVADVARREKEQGGNLSYESNGDAATIRFPRQVQSQRRQRQSHRGYAAGNA